MEERDDSVGNDTESTNSKSDSTESGSVVSVRSPGDLEYPSVDDGNKIPPEVYDEDRRDDRPEKNWMAIAIAAAYIGIGIYALWLGGQVLIGEFKNG